MNSFLKSFLIALLATSISGCVTLFPAQMKAGDTESEVIAKRGQPTNRYQDGENHLLEYSMGTFGQKTYMARLGPDGRVISFEQVLTNQKFASIKVGETKKADVLRLVGAPVETSYLPLRNLEVWSYPYKESNVWNSIMHIHFDQDGIVRQMMNGPDPRFEPDLKFPFGVGIIR